MLQFWRYLWPLPWTMAGAIAALLALATGSRWQVRQGALEVHGGRLAAACDRLPPGRRFEAITLGHVILGLDQCCLDASRAHEQVHVRQYERWGPLFVPAYLIAGAWQWANGRNPYHDNPFERQAYALAAVGRPSPVAGDVMPMVE